MNDNGEGKIDEIGEEIKEEYNGVPDEVKAVLNQSSLQNTFFTPHNVDTTRLLLTPGEIQDLTALLMRANVPGKKYNVAFASLYSELSHDPQALMELRMLIAGMTGQHGERAKLVSDTIIGEKHSSGRMGIGDKLKKMAGLGGTD